MNHFRASGDKKGQTRRKKGKHDEGAAEGAIKLPSVNQGAARSGRFARDRRRGSGDRKAVPLLGEAKSGKGCVGVRLFRRWVFRSKRTRGSGGYFGGCAE